MTNLNEGASRRYLVEGGVISLVTVDRLTLRVTFRDCLFRAECKITSTQCKTRRQPFRRFLQTVPQVKRLLCAYSLAYVRLFAVFADHIWLHDAPAFTFPHCLRHGNFWSDLAQCTSENGPGRTSSCMATIDQLRKSVRFPVKKFANQKASSPDYFYDVNAFAPAHSTEGARAYVYACVCACGLFVPLPRSEMTVLCRL